MQANQIRFTAPALFDNGMPSSASVTATSGIVLPANPNRKYVAIYNAGAEAVYFAYGSYAAVAQEGIWLLPGGTLEIINPICIGAINAVCDSGNSSTLSILEGT